MSWLPTETVSLDEAAARYASHGFRVIPVWHLIKTSPSKGEARCGCRKPDCVKSQGKHPIEVAWQKKATSDEHQALDARRGHSLANVGIALGGPERLIAIDIDGDDGRSSWQVFEDSFGPIPDTLTARSGRLDGGEHRIFRVPEHLDLSRIKTRSATNGIPGIDTRGPGGQIVAPPSIHFTGNRYRWANSCPVADIPDALFDAIAEKPRPVSVPSSARLSVATDSQESLLKRARAYISKCETAIDGAGGSQPAFAVARALRGWINRGLSESHAWSVLLEYNARCQPPWSERELRHKWESAVNAETIPVIEDRPNTSMRVISGGLSVAKPQPSSGSYDVLPPYGSGGPPSTNDPDWQVQLLWADSRTGKHKLISHVENVIRILQLHPAWAQRIQFDAFRGRTTVSDAPWDQYQRPTSELGTWTDEDTTRLNAWLRREFQSYGFSPSIQDCERAVPVVARTHDFNPVRDYLDELVWDGTPRLSTWLANYLGAEDGEYSRLVGAWWLISAVARIYEPGCKVDTVPILEGRQGLKKSSALRVLFGGEFFNDTPIDIGSKDAYTAIQGCWCVELAELDSLMRAEPTRSKAFFSSGKDRFRRAYARHDRDELRQCIFVGTTNGDEYLNDPTGGRRFWPIVCSHIDLESIATDRDQLWAEARHEYQEGRLWYPTAETEHVLLGDVQEGRTKGDAWEADIGAYLSRLPDGQTTVPDLLRMALKLESKDWTHAAQTRVGAIMANKFRGWAKRRVTVETGPDCRRAWAYVRSDR